MCGKLFSLAVFNIFSLPFNILTIRYLSVYFFVFTLLTFHQASWMCRLVFFIKFGDFQPLLLWSFFLYISLSSLIWMFLLVYVGMFNGFSYYSEPTPVFLPGKPHAQWNLVGYSPWDHKRVKCYLVTKQQQYYLEILFIFLYTFFFFCSSDFIVSVGLPSSSLITSSTSSSLLLIPCSELFILVVLFNFRISVLLLIFFN